MYTRYFTKEEPPTKRLIGIPVLVVAFLAVQAAPALAREKKAENVEKKGEIEEKVGEKMEKK